MSCSFIMIFSVCTNFKWKIFFRAVANSLQSKQLKGMGILRKRIRLWWTFILPRAFPTKTVPKLCKAELLIMRKLFVSWNKLQDRFFKFFVIIIQFLDNVFVKRVKFVQNPWLVNLLSCFCLLFTGYSSLTTTLSSALLLKEPSNIWLSLTGGFWPWWMLV